MAARFSERAVVWEYEATRLPWLPPKRHYIPDFKITNESGKVWYLELKGRLTSPDRMKMRCVKEQHPDVDIRLMFYKPFVKLYKGSKTTYGDWATQHGFLWCAEHIPQEWLDE